MSPDKKEHAWVVLMDLSKAFDTTNDELLFAKIHAYCFSKNVVKLLLGLIFDL